MTALRSKLLDSAVTPPAPLKPVIGQLQQMPDVPPPQPQHRQIKVMLCLPSGRTWEARTATCVAGIVGFSVQHGIHIGIANMEGSMITKQRNDLVEMARKENSDYMFFIDTDIVIPPDSLVRLLQHNKEVVGATYNKKVPPFETLGKLKGERPTDDELRKGGLREAELLPTGILLIKMSVFDKIPKPYFYESYEWPGNDGVECLKEYLRHNFATFADEDAMKELDENCPKLKQWLNATYALEPRGFGYFSEDLNACRKFIKCGVQIWCDLTLSFESVHLGTNPVSCSAPPKPTVLVAATM